jgi:hypothetical protein
MHSKLMIDWTHLEAEPWARSSWKNMKQARQWMWTHFIWKHVHGDRAHGTKLVDNDEAISWFRLTNCQTKNAIVKKSTKPNKTAIAQQKSQKNKESLGWSFWYFFFDVDICFFDVLKSHPKMYYKNWKFRVTFLLLFLFASTFVFFDVLKSHPNMY